ncbi:hypothetical protein RhiirA4_471903 [Rhizophagus irregularis]|uniref:Uncharacterized protein n=1 Tax=Rhizophagus irregularis TaxID=588596 RepID=A0A2I1H3X8_9GLOM|nr:hypothetical protein RhiirA4_471903 [Rhizophagus irregularis]
MINKLSVIPTVLVLKLYLYWSLDLAKQGRRYSWILNKHNLVLEERIKWNNENYEALKKLLNQFIPLIHKARPYKAIIKPKLVNVIYNWIDRNDSVTLSNNNKCKFNLVTSMMSRDGHNSETFHNICNELVVLIRVQSKKIYGGYNLSNWMRRKKSMYRWFLYMLYINEQDLFAGYNVYNYENIFGGVEEGETPKLKYSLQ